MRKHFQHLAAGDLIFNPYSQLERQIKLATDRVSKHFDSIGAAMNKGQKVKKAVQQAGELNAALKRVIVSSRLSGFAHGSKYVKKALPAEYGSLVSAAATKRAKKINKLMKLTTKKGLASQSEFALSRDRALRAAKYEAGKAYFKGVADAFRGTGWGKAWITSSEEPCDACVENEDQDVIGVEEAFDSGHMNPPIHPNCQCYLAMRKMGEL